jgi:hypothetical protein
MHYFGALLKVKHEIEFKETRMHLNGASVKL